MQCKITKQVQRTSLEITKVVLFTFIQVYAKEQRVKHILYFNSDFISKFLKTKITK